jgi:ATP-dependent Clp protease ATP-binding subunit ClpX
MSDAMFHLPSTSEKVFLLTKSYAQERLEQSTLVKLKVA